MGDIIEMITDESYADRIPFRCFNKPVCARVTPRDGSGIKSGGILLPGITGRPWRTRCSMVCFWTTGLVCAGQTLNRHIPQRNRTPAPIHQRQPPRRWPELALRPTLPAVDQRLFPLRIRDCLRRHCPESSCRSAANSGPRPGSRFRRPPDSAQRSHGSASQRRGRR
jgi:hypothetical protein